MARFVDIYLLVFLIEGESMIVFTNKLNIILAIAMSLTMVSANTYASSSDSRYGLESKYTISGDDLIQIKRGGRMNLKRVIKRKILDKLPKGAELNSVTVWAKAVGPESTMDLEVGREIMDHKTLRWSPPVCKIVDVTKVITRKDGTTREVTRPKEVCTESVPQTVKTVLHSVGEQGNAAWILSADVDLKVSKVVVDTTIPVSYEIENVHVGSGKADKIISAGRSFPLNGSVDSITVKASKKSINLSSVVVHFSDGTSQSVDSYGKVSVNSSGKTVTISKPFKRATSITVYATARKLFGSRGKMEVSADYIVSEVD